MVLKLEITGLIVGLAYGPNDNYHVHIVPYIYVDQTNVWNLGLTPSFLLVINIFVQIKWFQVIDHQNDIKHTQIELNSLNSYNGRLTCDMIKVFVKSCIALINNVDVVDNCKIKFSPGKGEGHGNTSLR